MLEPREREQGLGDARDLGVRDGHAVAHARARQPLPAQHRVREAGAAGGAAEAGRERRGERANQLFARHDLGVEDDLAGPEERRDRVRRAAEDADQRRSGDERGDHGHDHQRHEELLADDAGLEREHREEDLHGAAGVHPEADGGRLAPRDAAEARAHRAPGDLGDAGDGDHQRDQAQIEGRREVVAERHGGEEHRREHVAHEVVQDVPRVLAEAGAVADGDADHEAAEHRVHPQRLRRGGAQQRQHHDHGEDPPLAAWSGPWSFASSRSTTGRTTVSTPTTNAPVISAETTMPLPSPSPRVKRCERTLKPVHPTRIVEDRRGEDDDAEVGLHQAQVEQGLGNHRQRRDGERDAEEGGVQASLRGIGEVGPGQQEARRVAEPERDDDAEHAGDEHHTAALAHHGEVDLEAGHHQEQHHRDRGVAPEHRPRGAVGEEPREAARRDAPEDGLAEHHAGDDLAGDGGEAPAAADLAQGPRDTEEHGEPQQEQQDVVVHGGGG